MPVALPAADSVNSAISASSIIGHTDAGPGTGDDDAYLPRSALTQPPAPQAQIDLPYPDVAPQGSYHAVLTLFIDETGQVRRVRVEEVGAEGLPPELEEAARQTFLTSRFSPGELNGQPVKSQIRIAVDFTSESASAPAGPASDPPP